MTCGKGNTKQETFFFNNEKLEFVNTFKYLGIMLDRSASFKHANAERCKKAKRAMFMVSKALSTTGTVNIKMALSVFDKQIIPILLYGSSIWALPKCHNYVPINTLKGKKKHH